MGLPKLPQRIERLRIERLTNASLRPNPSFFLQSFNSSCCTKNLVLASSYEQTGVSMTGRKTSRPRPTDGELEILRVLWERGASTVRQVHDTLEARRPAGYTTVLKLLQIMTEKGLVRRDE